MVGWMKEIVSNTHPLIVYGSYLTVTCAFNFKLNILIFFFFLIWFCYVICCRYTRNLPHFLVYFLWGIYFEVSLIKASFNKLSDDTNKVVKSSHYLVFGIKYTHISWKNDTRLYEYLPHIYHLHGLRSVMIQFYY